MSNNKLSVLDMPAPAGYVPGLGRGATGFTTRSDIGPAKAGIAEDAIKVINEKGGSDGVNGESGAIEDEAERFRDPENDSGLLGSEFLDADDTEADKIYELIDKRMEERRKQQREEREKAEQDEFERKNPKISTQFKDLKRALGSVSADEWASLPEVGDLTRKNKRQRKDMENRFYAVPDSVIMSARNTGVVESSIEATNETDGTMTDFRSISLAKDKMLSLRLDQANIPNINGVGGVNVGSNKNGLISTTPTSSLVPPPVYGGSSTIDPKGYLTSLSNTGSISGAEIGDIKRVRPLLESLVKTDPKEPRGWIGLARLEEIARRMNKARSVIQQGCENCPKNEDVWLENIRLNDKQTSKILASRAISMIPKSINLWLSAAGLEDDINSKKKVIQKALESNPTSDTLWKMAVNLESEPTDAKLLLAQAVELVPLAEDLWLALARLESYKNARKVLSKARKALRVSRAVWVAAARLEEQEKQDPKTVDNIMLKGVRELDSEGGLPERGVWIADAEECEKEGASLTCHAIIKATISQGLNESTTDNEDKKATWLDDAKSCISHGAIDTARSIYNHALSEFPDSRTLWMALVQLEKTSATSDSYSLNRLWDTFEKAVSACPSTEDFWLLYYTEKAATGDTNGAQEILARAFKSNPKNESIWLAAVRLEVKTKQYERASKLLARARHDAGTERVWVQSVVLERQLKHPDQGLKLIEQGLQHYPESAKLHMQKGQIFASKGDISGSRSAYTIGTRSCPKSVTLWLLLASLEESHNGIVRARAILDRASRVNEKNPLIWLHRIQLEKRSGNESQAMKLMSKALQECPKSGLLWSEYISLQPRPSRMQTLKQAVTECEHDPYVLTTAGRFFWSEKKLPMAKKWLDRAVKADQDNGDAWLWLYKFSVSNDKSSDIARILEQVQIANPKQGLIWPSFLKDIDNFEKPFVNIFTQAALSLVD